MASHVFMVDSRARKARIPTTPATYLNDVLHQGCLKLGLSPDDYVLKFNSKLVDLSRTIRLAGLPAGAQLDLVRGSRSATVITVALQLPEAENNRRITHKFSSATSIWEILRVIETQEKLNFTERGEPSSQNGAGRLFYEMPSLNIMNRELASFEDLQKTLQQLGVNSGNVLLKLRYRVTEQPLEQAMQEISHHFNTSSSHAIHNHLREQADHARSPDAPTNSALCDNSNDSVASQTAQPIVTSTQTQTVQDHTSRPAGTIPPPQIEDANLSARMEDTNFAPPVNIFAPTASGNPRAVAQVWNEADYIPTVEHAAQHQARLQQETRNKRLASDAELAARERDRKAKQDAVSSVKVRIRLPDQMLIETDFRRGSCTGKHIYDFVKAQIRHPDQTFLLRYVDATGLHLTMSNSASPDLIAEAGWKGSILVSMIWDVDIDPFVRQSPALKHNLIEQAKTLSIDVNGPSQNNSPEKEKERQAGFLGHLFNKESRDKPKMANAEKEAKIKNFLGFKKK